MKKLFIGLPLLLFSILCFAQDMLITKQNDTINCKIKEIKNGKLIYTSFSYYNYTQKSIDTINVADTSMNYHIQLINDPAILSSLHSHYIITHSLDTIYCNLIQNRDIYVVYSELIGGKEIIKGIPKYTVLDVHKIKRIKKTNNEKDHFEIKFGGGTAHLLAEKPSDLSTGEKKLNDELSNGFYLNGSFRYVFKGKWGTGLQYSHFKSSGDGSIPIRIEDEVFDFPISLEVHINFLAAQGLLAIPSKNGKFRLGVKASLGPLFYLEEGKIDGIYTSTKGATMGLGFGAELVYFLAENFGLSLNMNIITGSLKKVDFTFGEETTEFKLDKENKMNIGHIELGGALVVRF